MKLWQFFCGAILTFSFTAAAYAQLGGPPNRKLLPLGPKVGTVNPAPVAPRYPMGAPVEAKLLDANNGWVLTNDGRYRLFWTSDFGADWKEITPSVAPGSPIESVSFSSATAGSVLIGGSTPTGEPTFSLASTTDGGATWTTMPINLPGTDPANTAPGGSLAFADALHGWLVVGFVGSSNFRPGGVFMTSDGGHTWQAQKVGAGDGSVVAVGANEAWFVGSPNDWQLWGTSDGLDWNHVALPAPAGLYSVADSLQAWIAASPTYSLPVFTDPQHGFAVTTYSGTSATKSVAVLFATTDAGKAWKADRMITGLPEMSAGQKVVSALAGTSWIIAEKSNNGPFTLIKLGPGANLTASAEMVTDCLGTACYPKSLSFVSS